MKATLLIKNIENLYTCDENNTIIQQAFIALHHDKIIDLGKHDPRKWIDDATRMIDARGECVVPSFIDCAFLSSPRFLDGDKQRKESDTLYAMKQNGILTLITSDPSLRRKELFQEVIAKKQKVNLPIIDRFQERMIPEEFILSCGINKDAYKLYSMHPLGFVLYNIYHVKALNILNAMTRNPAKAFHLDHLGQLAIGKNGDLLVLNTHSIDEYFSQSGIPMIHRMIKSGIQFYPEIIRS